MSKKRNNEDSINRKRLLNNRKREQQSKITDSQNKQGISYTLHVDPKTGKRSISNYHNNINIKENPKDKLMREALQRLEKRIMETHKNYDIMYNASRNQYKLVEVDNEKTYKIAHNRAKKSHSVLMFDFVCIFNIMKQALLHCDYYVYKHMASIIAVNVQLHPASLNRLSDLVLKDTRLLYNLDLKRFLNVILDLNAHIQYEICNAYISKVYTYNKRDTPIVYTTLSDILTDFHNHYYAIWPKKLVQASSIAVKNNSNGQAVLDEVFHYLRDNKSNILKIIRKESLRSLYNDYRNNKAQDKTNKLIYHIDNDVYTGNASALSEHFKNLTQIMQQNPILVKNIYNKIQSLHRSFKKEDISKDQEIQFRKFLLKGTLNTMQLIYDDHDLYESNENLRVWLQNQNSFLAKYVFNNLNPQFTLPAKDINEASKDISRLIQYVQSHKEELLSKLELPFYSGRD